MGFEAPDNKFRDYQIWGEVHDGNAWFMGGVAGILMVAAVAGAMCRINRREFTIASEPSVHNVAPRRQSSPA